MFLLSMTLTHRPTGPPSAMSHNELPRFPLNIRTDRIIADMMRRSVIWVVGGGGGARRR